MDELNQGSPMGWIRWALRFNNGFLALLSFAFLAIFIVLLFEMHRDAWRQAMTTMDDHVNSVSGDVLRDVEMFDGALRSLQTSALLARPEQTRSMLQMLSGPLSRAGRLLILDETGSTGGRAGTPGASYGQIDFFKSHLETVRHSLFIGSPFTDPASGEPAIGFSRRLQDTSGAFAGVVAVVVPMAYLRESTEGLEATRTSAVGLYKADGTALVSPFRSSAAAGIPQSSKELLPYLSKFSSLLIDRDPYSGIKWVTKFRRVRNFPLVVTASVSEEKIYAFWREIAWALGAVYAILIVAFAAFGFRLTRELKLRRMNEHRYRQLSDLDGLTGIANRRRFDESAVMQWQRAEQTCKALSLLLIDIDHFKNFNDSYGHQQGDDCLRLVAETAGQCVRDTDLLARYGGEELVVVLPGLDIATAQAVAERIRSSIEALAVPHRGHPTRGVVTVSVGCAATYPACPPVGATVADLVAAADRALYRAKASGRNMVAMEDVIAPPPFERPSRERVQGINEIRRREAKEHPTEPLPV
ncbi:sensor domain-containing diguanylate cyclase [Consotaella salsifontis]|uniref:diguanylate cyclase n=1 Tax=Consotaella salsifontis TaxID=1365950 RepID=A0A1T4SX00_9HYPH|nr:diguanylate cyclase [Consotaella salsifontis]SKA32784.1 diguanylate cyclase (GGDEF) domain-containing protein [Consotaella salsifontis]